MPSMLTSLASATRVVLLPTTAPAPADSGVKIRRYKLARVRQDERNPADRHAHLRRSHD